MVYCLYISICEVDIKCCPSYPCDNPPFRKPHLKKRSRVYRPHNSCPCFSRLQCSRQFYSGIVFCHFESLYGHARELIEPSHRVIWPVYCSKGRLFCDNDIFLFKVVLFSYGHIYRHISTDNGSCSLFDHHIWGNRVITMECLVVEKCRVSKHEKKPKKKNEKRSNENFFHIGLEKRTILYIVRKRM